MNKYQQDWEDYKKHYGLEEVAVFTSEDEPEGLSCPVYFIHNENNDVVAKYAYPVSKGEFIKENNQLAMF